MRLRIESEDELASVFRAMGEQLAKRGYASTNVEPIEITHMTEASALIRAEGVRIKADGSPLERFKASYIVENEAAGGSERRFVALYGETRPL